ncbi:hypothetical protein [Pasteuria penetrans]|uniref:hypothetical protein n=1 Tax=Pasteuria penetrans TaxID=86005 RepID=UPI000FB8CD04|nr:hypothetical protein [Pasteuria penetrans]
MVGGRRALFRERGIRWGSLREGNKDPEEKICPSQRISTRSTKKGPTEGFYAREK